MDKALLRYILRRVFEAIPLLVGVIVVMFLLLQLAPGDPIQAMVGDFPASQEYIDKLRHDFGLDKPTYQQLFDYFKNVLRGNLGYSFANRRPVMDLVSGRILNTLLLTVTALIVSAFLGVGLGVLASKSPRSFTDGAITVLSLVGFSIPVFWLGQILIIVFAINLDLLPAQGMRSLRVVHEGSPAVKDVALHLILPMLALSARYLGINARMTRASMLEVMGKDFIITARAKGCPERTVIVRHGLRNALIPVVTVIGYNFGFALSGSALVETVFGWPGMGRLLYDSMVARDTAVIIGIFLVVAITAIIANLLTDLVYGILDPRIRTQ
jgi:peptide/nickel transport system permease protein